MLRLASSPCSSPLGSSARRWRQASWQRTGAESPPWERSSQSSKPRVMRGDPRGPR
jgi:hypothetical protein